MFHGFNQVIDVLEREADQGIICKSNHIDRPHQVMDVTDVIIIILGFIFQIPSHNETVYKGKMVLFNFA
jgi:hypothetical protein